MNRQSFFVVALLISVVGTPVAFADGFVAQVRPITPVRTQTRPVATPAPLTYAAPLYEERIIPIAQPVMEQPQPTIIYVPVEKHTRSVTRIIERPVVVEKPVIVEKIVEKPVIREVERIVERPVYVERERKVAPRQQVNSYRSVRTTRPATQYIQRNLYDTRLSSHVVSSVRHHLSYDAPTPVFTPRHQTYNTIGSATYRYSDYGNAYSGGYYGDGYIHTPGYKPYRW